MSFAEDMGLDAYDGPEESDTREYEWEDKYHNIKLIRVLETGHIESIIKGLESGKGYWGQVIANVKAKHLERIAKYVEELKK